MLLVASRRIGVCPRCSIEGNRTSKPLLYCPFCGGYFCEVHAKPRLVMSFQAYQSYLTTYKDIANVLREHWQSADGHPCPAYTRRFWQEYERRKREEQLPPLPAKARGPREEVTPRRWERETPLPETSVRPRPVPYPSEERGKGVKVWGGRRKGKRGTKALALVLIFILATALAVLLFTDTDEDGLVLASELAHGTNPFNRDSDGDGIPDGDEVRLGTSPLLSDTDGDGLSDRQELELKTNPLSKDSDGDGLDDLYEVRSNLNPTLSDTDGDGLNDGDEVLRFRTKPLDPDSDDDLLLDGDEVRLGTNPLLNDTDGDGLADGYEVKIGTDPRKNWRYSFDKDALKSALSCYFRNRISHLATLLEGSTDVETVWNVLKWIDRNIQYDEEKASSSGKGLYAPHETINLKRGICSDYSLLTASLLLETGFSEVYLLVLSSYQGDHASVAVIVNGVTYVLDQHLPPKRFSAYISKGWEINKVYRVRLNSEKEPEVESVSPYSLPQRESGVNEQEVIETLRRIFFEYNPFIRWDNNLGQCTYSVHLGGYCTLPFGYREVMCYRSVLDPENLSRDFLYYYLKEFVVSGDLLTSARSYNRVYILADYHGYRILVTLCFARA